MIEMVQLVSVLGVASIVGLCVLIIIGRNNRK
jgi:hypothetical protein